MAFVCLIFSSLISLVVVLIHALVADVAIWQMIVNHFVIGNLTFAVMIASQLAFREPEGDE